ncbi:serine hydrolase domain-containing protein [Novipirellula artificiosorum]|uniref:Esterase EstB n=1 Tax=Novipirellula artificiosorum TaxID=2528016 RepID=A0A5C6DIY3_9BACT|nr:serine hydrolase domain-containing protein [Novipirellula artificiosorum]TWU34849.1 Esterase EstB [Novipirellula artificiosorum]
MKTHTIRHLITMSALGIWCFVAGTLNATAQELPTSKPEDVGVSSEKVKELSTFMQGLVDDGKIAGGVTMLARDGKVVHLEAVGMSDREAKVPMKTDSIFRIASMTKPITSVAVMMLWEQGKIGLDDPVSKFIPEFKNPDVLVSVNPLVTRAAKREITIRDLLTHTSGLGYEFSKDIGPIYHQHGIQCGDCPTDMTLEEMIETLAGLPLLFDPGTKFEYGMSYAVLGRLVEVVSDGTLERFYDRNIFQPLQMHDTFFRVPHDKLSRLAPPYVTDGNSIRKLEPGEILDWKAGVGTYKITADAAYSESNKYLNELCSTADDYMRFCQMILNLGELEGTRLLSSETVKKMTANQLGSRSGGYGFGFGVLPNTDDVHQQLRDSIHWAGGWSTSFHISPRGNWALVTLTQLAWSDSTPGWFERYRTIAAEAIND